MAGLGIPNGPMFGPIRGQPMVVEQTLIVIPGGCQTNENVPHTYTQVFPLGISQVYDLACVPGSFALQYNTVFLFPIQSAALGRRRCPR
jgi:hypothetical protein